jgi:ribosomal protein S18 acetylase RimI-like enzyme
MDAEDLPFVTRLHRAYLPEGFFVQLGDAFLRSYYRSYLTSPASVALIGEVDGVRAGFLVGTVDHDAYTRHVGRHHRAKLFAAGARALLRRPGLARTLIGTRLARYGSRLRRARHRPAADDQPTRVGVLSHLAVEQPMRRTGLGRALVVSYSGIALLHGTRRLRLDARAESGAARRLYLSLGWRPGEEYRDADGVRWARFSREL